MNIILIYIFLIILNLIGITYSFFRIKKNKMIFILSFIIILVVLLISIPSYNSNYRNIKNIHEKVKEILKEKQLNYFDYNLKITKNDNFFYVDCILKRNNKNSVKIYFDNNYKFLKLEVINDN